MGKVDPFKEFLGVIKSPRLFFSRRDRRQRIHAIMNLRYTGIVRSNSMMRLKV